MTTMFYKETNDYLYFDQLETLIDVNCYLPLEVDTEYVQLPYNLNNPSKNVCTNLTVQCKSIDETTGFIYAHPDNAPLARHPLMRHGWVVGDYLESMGYEVNFSRLANRDAKTSHPILQIDIYSFFLVSELMRMFQGEYLEDIRYLCTNPGKSGIEQGRRARAYTRTRYGISNWVLMPWLITINEIDYHIKLSLGDTCALHGITNYKDFCSNSGVILSYKDNFTDAEKSRMDIQYSDRPEDFDNYALGDLNNYQALMGNIENFEKIYQSLGLEAFFNIPRFTIGATVSKIVEAAIYKVFNLNVADKAIINRFCKFASADYLKRKITSTGCLNAKVDGGRCRNNRPTDTVATGVICDIDISSCYGEGLRVQTYPLGIPFLIDYPIDSEINRYETLRDFLKKYGSELVPGLWQARVSLKPDYKLQYKQDYLASWYPPNDISRMSTDSDFEDTDQWWTVDNVGEVKVFTSEINNAVITHDFVQWLDNVASEKQREELLDYLEVKTALFYPASKRVNSISELLDKHSNHKGENVTLMVKGKQGKLSKVSKEEECYNWYGINLGEMLVDKLLLKRKEYDKKEALNVLYKLCINTVYGDMVSPFFTIGNVVVGNNITARARALAWCMEKGLHGWQSITDGCAFQIDRILHPRNQRINGVMVVNLYADKDGYHHKFAPLPYLSDNSDTLIKVKTVELIEDENSVYIELENGHATILKYNDALNWINKATMLHLQSLFPNLDILHQETVDVKGNSRIGQFEFEAKGIYDRATFHGTANYSLGLKDTRSYKMRSYSKKHRKMIVLADDLQVSESETPPSEIFLKALDNPKRIGRSPVFIKDRILKVKDYKRNYSKYKDSPVYPGVTIETASYFKEFSLTQYTFETYEQLKSWRREQEKFLKDYGQSYEMFFLNPDGSLNYQQMVVTIDARIRAGLMNILDGLEPGVKRFYKNYIEHINRDCLIKTKSQLEQRYLCLGSEESDRLDESYISDSVFEIGDDELS